MVVAELVFTSPTGEDLPSSSLVRGLDDADVSWNERGSNLDIRATGTLPHQSVTVEAVTFGSWAVGERRAQGRIGAPLPASPTSSSQDHRDEARPVRVRVGPHCRVGRGPSAIG